MIRSSYLKDATDINKLPRVITQLANAILEWQWETGLDYHAIAFRGMSGALVVPMLCRRLNKGMIVCRKESERSHGDLCEGLLIGGNYIIVDDFISCGHTVRGIAETIEKYRTRFGEPEFPSSKLLAVFLYQRVHDSYTIEKSVCVFGQDIPVYGVKTIFNYDT